MSRTAADLPDDPAALRHFASALQHDLAVLEATVQAQTLLVEKLKHQLAVLWRGRARFGRSSEKLDQEVEQLELLIGHIEESAAEAQATIARSTAPMPAAAERKPSVRVPLPAHLPTETIVHDAPCVCPSCGGTALGRIGADEREVLERIPARWHVIQHVRERFSCRACATISQEPAPFHPIGRGRAGPDLLAEVVFGKFGLHLPLHRQSERFAREGVPIEGSTLADWVGAVTTALSPLVGLIESHVHRGSRIHLDDTPVPVLAKGRTRTGRLWTAVRDDRPFGGPDPPAAAYFYSADRSGSCAETWLGSYAGIVQADAFSGFGRLYEPGRTAGTMIEAGCRGHARRKFFELADLQKAPMAIEAVTRMDAIFAIEREINGRKPNERQAVRTDRCRPLVVDLQAWLQANRAKLSPKARMAVAIDYMLKRWPAFTRFLDDGRICLSNNAAERAIRRLAVGRRNWTFAGSDAGGRRAAAMYTLIETAKLNGVDPRAWLAYVLGRINDHPAQLGDLLPWAWKATSTDHVQAA